MNIYNGSSFRNSAASQGAARREMNLQTSSHKTETIYRSIQTTSMPQSAGPYRAFTGIPMSRDRMAFVPQTSAGKAQMPQQQAKFRVVEHQKPAIKSTTYFVPYLPVDLQDYGLDECSYVFSNLPADKLVPQILRAFSTVKVDHDELRTDTCSCNCTVVMESGSQVSFSMEIFRLTPAEQEENGRLGEYLVVLQRYCSVFPSEWKKFISSVFWDMVQSKAVATNFTLLPPGTPLAQGPAGSLSAGSLCQPPALDRTPSAVAEQERNLKHLLELAQSPFADVKEQASGILMSLSRNVDTASLLARLEAVRCLCDGISAGDQESDWTRSAIATIANVCEKHSFVGESEHQLVGVLDVVVQLFLALKDSTSYLKQELKRETTRALAELTAVQSVKTHIARHGSNTELASAVQSCMRSGDARLASLASRALGNLV